MAILKVTTSRGELEWVTISGEGKENLSGKLQYVANIVLDDDAANEMNAKIDKFWEDNKPPKFKKAPKSTGAYVHKVKQPEPDADGDPVYEETGKTYFAFKTGTSFPDGSAKKVKTYNSKAKPVELGEIKIGNGSIGQISGAMGIYANKDAKGNVLEAGVTLYLDGIKISKLVEYSEEAGFDADEGDEDGFTGDEGFEGHDDAKVQPRL